MNYVVIRLGDEGVDWVVGPFSGALAAETYTRRVEFVGVQTEVHGLVEPKKGPEDRARELGYDSVDLAFDALESMTKDYEETEHSAEIRVDCLAKRDEDVRTVMSRRTPQELDKGWAKLGSE